MNNEFSAFLGFVFSFPLIAATTAIFPSTPQNFDLGDTANWGGNLQ